MQLYVDQRINVDRFNVDADTMLVDVADQRINVVDALMLMVFSTVVVECFFYTQKANGV